MRGSCSLSRKLNTYWLDADDAHLVVEGTAERVADEAVLQRVAAAYLSKYAWEVTVREGVFDADYGAPTAGPPPYALYQLRPSTVFAFGADEIWSPTRYAFSSLDFIGHGRPRPRRGARAAAQARRLCPVLRGSRSPHAAVRASCRGGGGGVRPQLADGCT
jgi:hypothetical protein